MSLAGATGLFLEKNIAWQKLMVLGKEQFWKVLAKGQNQVLGKEQFWKVLANGYVDTKSFEKSCANSSWKRTCR